MKGTILMSQLEIRYCVMWNYYPYAASVAQTLKDNFDLTTTLTPGNRGEFTVWIDNKKIIEKVGDDFPPEDKIISAVGQMIA